MTYPANYRLVVYTQIAGRASRDLGVELSATDVAEILEAQTLGWQDGVVNYVRHEADEYGIPHK
jgi:hypothetical protein